MEAKHLLVYSDSTALPRWPEISPNATWPSLISHKYSSLHLRAVGGTTSQELINLFQKDLPYFGVGTNKDIILILSFGIVDFAPRPITYKMKILSRLPFFGKIIWDKLNILLHPLRPKIQKIISYRLTTPQKFQKHVETISIASKGMNRIFVLSTPQPSEAVCMRSPGLKESINQLNAIKYSLAKKHSMEFVELENICDLDYVSIEDGHHFSISGHKKIAEVVMRRIQEH